MTTSEPPPDLLCDTTPIRYFTIVGKIDLLALTAGGALFLPREVLDPEEQEGVSGSSQRDREEREVFCCAVC